MPDVRWPPSSFETMHTWGEHHSFSGHRVDLVTDVRIRIFAKLRERKQTEPCRGRQQPDRRRFHPKMSRSCSLAPSLPTFRVRTLLVPTSSRDDHDRDLALLSFVCCCWRLAAALLLFHSSHENTIIIHTYIHTYIQHHSFVQCASGGDFASVGRKCDQSG
jgi:hypothetical protein